jgi:hypothetical protein
VDHRARVLRGHYLGTGGLIMNRHIYIGRDDDIATVLRHLLDLADSPNEVQMQVGTREVLVSDAVAERFEGAANGPDLDSVEEPEETPAPRRRARKAAPTAEES